MTTLLDARSVTYAIDRIELIAGVDFRVGSGELVAVIGPNGAGKSTLFAVLAGDLRATDGSVVVGERNIDELDFAELAEFRAVLSQRRQAGIPFRVGEVVAMGARHSVDSAALHEILEAMDVSDLVDRVVGTLSGGEHTRVELARVLMQNTPLLLLDEPLTALDIAHQELVMRHLRRRAEAGQGFAVILHDLNAAAAYADRFVLMNRGSVVADGDGAAVLDSGVLAEVYRCGMRVARVGRRTVIVPTD